MEFILKKDRSLPSNKRTVWYLKVPNVLEYLNIQRSDAREALILNWLTIVQKVENYQFGYKFRIKKKTFDNKELILKVLSDITKSDADEIIEAAVKHAFINPIQRKKLEFTTFYYKWKASKTERGRLYDCESCLKQGWIEKQDRKCFRFNNEIEIPFPVFQLFDDEGNDLPVPRPTNDVDFRLCQTDDVYQWFVDMENLWPDRPVFDIHQSYIKKLCIESLTDHISTEYFRLETACAEYGVGILDIPYNLFEPFEMIRSTKNIYDNLENLKTEQKLKQKK